MKTVQHLTLIAFHMAFGSLVGGVLGLLVLVPKAASPDECGNGVVVAAMGVGATLGSVVLGIVGCINVDRRDAKSVTPLPDR